MRKRQLDVDVDVVDNSSSLSWFEKRNTHFAQACLACF